MCVKKVDISPLLYYQEHKLIMCGGGLSKKSGQFTNVFHLSVCTLNASKPFFKADGLFTCHYVRFSLVKMDDDCVLC